MAGIIGGVILALLLVYFWYLKTFLYLCRPNEALVFSGRQQKKDDVTTGFRVIIGGRAYRTPLVERVDRMDLTVFPVHIHIAGAFSRGNIALNVHAIANVKIARDERLINNAIERFLGRDPSEIHQVAKETLEGNLRGILATLTPEEVNEDRLKFADRLAEDAEEDLRRLGLHLDTLKIQNVSDDVQYLDSIGRKRIAEVVRDAEIAESNARREAETAVADAEALGKVAQEQAETIIKQKSNELRRIQAELMAQIRSVEEQAIGYAEAARAEAGQALESVRIELENLRLQADKVIPAEIEREAAKLIAAGRAAPIAAHASATAQAMDLLTGVWVEAGDDAFDIFIIQQLERIMVKVAEAVKRVQIAEVVLIDSGDGSTLPAYVSSYPQIVSALLREMKDTIGLDVARAITGTHGNGTSPPILPPPVKETPGSGFTLEAKTRRPAQTMQMSKLAGDES